MSDLTMQLFPDCPDRMGGTLIPALEECPDCHMIHEIASPELGVCPDCGAAMRVLSASQV
jgi:Zn finger protein HypA/HybF involved in hydrogenase expression